MARHRSRISGLTDVQLGLHLNGALLARAEIERPDSLDRFAASVPPPALFSFALFMLVLLPSLLRGAWLGLSLARPERIIDWRDALNTRLQRAGQDAVALALIAELSGRVKRAEAIAFTGDRRRIAG
jgi:hypothetical protein